MSRGSLGRLYLFSRASYTNKPSIWWICTPQRPWNFRLCAWEVGALKASAFSLQLLTTRDSEILQTSQVSKSNRIPQIPPLKIEISWLWTFCSYRHTPRQTISSSPSGLAGLQTIRNSEVAQNIRTVNSVIVPGLERNTWDRIFQVLPRRPVQGIDHPQKIYETKKIQKVSPNTKGAGKGRAFHTRQESNCSFPVVVYLTFQPKQNFQRAGSGIYPYPGYPISSQSYSNKDFPWRIRKPSFCDGDLLQLLVDLRSTQPFNSFHQSSLLWGIHWTASSWCKWRMNGQEGYSTILSINN